MKLLCVGYRSWALNIYDRLAESLETPVFIIRSKEQFRESVIKDLNPDLILFYGWSWIVPEYIINQFKCLMLHPSNLPNYRGGSPIQNQIIDGVVDTKLTIFIMNNELDSGDILVQSDLCLSGSIADIFSRIQDIGFNVTLKIINNKITPIPQDHSKATYCKRRSPSDSEITIEEIQNMGSDYLFNKIRMLTDPYPNAFIRTKDGKKLLIKSVELIN